MLINQVYFADYSRGKITKVNSISPSAKVRG